MAPGDPLSFTATVPRHLVHRRAVAEVLLTDWRRIGDNAFVCAAQWSRSHSLYRVRHGRHDPLLLAETIRQVGLLLCHEAFHIPATHRFLMRRLTYEADLEGLRAGGAPAEIVVAVRIQQPRPRTRSTRAVWLEVEFFRDEVVIGQGSGGVVCVQPRLYDRLRSPRPPPATVPQPRPVPLPPAAVGLHEPDDVVLGQGCQPGVWPLRIVTDHPVLFDHPLDHVPGMLSLEGMRQAGRAALGWPTAQLTACEATFSRLIDLTQPSWISATIQQQSANTASALMTITQADCVAAHGTVTITNVSAAGPPSQTSRAG